MTRAATTALALETQRRAVLFPADRDANGLVLAHVIGALLMVTLATAVTWERFNFWSVPEARGVVALSVAAYGLAAVATARLTSLPRSGPLAAILIGTTASFVVVLAGLALFRLPYSRLYLACAWILATVCHAAAYGVQPHLYPRFAVVPGKLTDRLCRLPGASWVPLQQADDSDVDAVVLDPVTAASSEWMASLTEWKLNGVKLIDGRAVYELFTGRVPVEVGPLLNVDLGNARTFYPAFRRIAEMTALLCMMPILVPLGLLVAVAIRLDSRGPVFFWQERMGYGGRPFRMCKFRTMGIDSELSGPKFATIRDGRVTRLGKFLRQSRLDELPQLWNVLLGDMSVIGPRPEQFAFARKFQEEIPAYGFRHLVKPGITGWAQVNQGYAANSEETRTKLEYDLYYVKNLSPWLDASVVLKTLRTVATGFGSR